MPLAKTSLAIGAVSELLKEQLHSKTGLEISIGRPQPAPQQPGKRLNLFLYEAGFDPSLKNTSLAEDRPLPLWLVLKYLITAYDDDKESDTFQAHEYLGQGLRALQELSLINMINSLDPDVPQALKDNPEMLKITFDEVSADLISKIMQGPDDKYRYSMGFQVRPVLIASAEPPGSNLLVGIDYTQNPEAVLGHGGQDGISVQVLPSLGPWIDRVLPEKFEIQAALTVLGRDFNPKDMQVSLDGRFLALDAGNSNDKKMICQADGSLQNGQLSPGSHPLTVVQSLAGGRVRSSNMVIAHLLPSVTQVGFTLLGGSAYGSLEVDGFLLGSATDDILLGLYRLGKVANVYDTFTTALDQKKLLLTIPSGQAPAPGAYRVILSVNGEQARQSPEVVLP